MRALLVLLLLAASAFAVEPGERLADPALEARARALSQELRCLVCQNQSIDDSSAPLARDLRLLVRERLAAGDDDAAVRSFLVARYGDFVLLRPPVKAATLALWLAPPATLVLGAAVAVLALRRRRRPAAAGLSEAERARVAALLADAGDGSPGAAPGRDGR
ncbi:cytochrome c-type biogenesis protein [Stella sp.]|uniref:cytochrome c-type biogenesis protein n=1 Tax=Stella sp. TaxID=2912054 RepID=UPI0035B1BCBC